MLRLRASTMARLPAPGLEVVAPPETAPPARPPARSRSARRRRCPVQIMPRRRGAVDVRCASGDRRMTQDGARQPRRTLDRASPAGWMLGVAAAYALGAWAGKWFAAQGR